MKNQDENADTDTEKAQKTLPEGIDEADVKAKVAAGLTREQAIEVLLAQKEHDEAQGAETGGKTTDEMPEDLNELTVAELKELASKRGVEVTQHMNKSEIIDALEETR
jgi:hypothetical protein